MKPRPDWQDEAACKGKTDVFYPELGKHWEAIQRAEREAKEICRACPVRPDCFAYVWANPEEHGVWAGYDARERRKWRSRRRIGSMATCWCGKTFAIRHGNQIHCSRACSHLAAVRRNQNNPDAPPVYRRREMA